MNSLSDIFKNNSDCYADTWYTDHCVLMEGDVIPAMTEERFIEVVCELLRRKENEITKQIINDNT